MLAMRIWLISNVNDEYRYSYYLSVTHATNSATQISLALNNCSIFHIMIHLWYDRKNPKKERRLIYTAVLYKLKTSNFNMKVSAGEWGWSCGDLIKQWMSLEKGVNLEGRESRFSVVRWVVKITTASIGFENGSWQVFWFVEPTLGKKLG